MNEGQKLRSLYVDDIPGAKPAKRVYDKSLIRRRHEEEMFRFGREEKRQIDWHVLPRIHVQPMDRKDEDMWKTKRTLLQSDQIGSPSTMSKSLMFSTINPNQKSLSPESIKDSKAKLQRSNILSGSAKNSLNTSKDPYFPHKYISDPFGEKNKWTGNKFWIDEPEELKSLPATKGAYFAKWS